MPIGGMAAQMQNPRRLKTIAKALRDIWFDKLRERLTGLFMINGTGARHLSPELGRDHHARRTSKPGRESLVTDVNELQAVVDKLHADERKRSKIWPAEERPHRAARALGNRSDGRSKLFSEDARKKLLARPQGPTTEDGLRYAMYMATEFMYQQLLGNNAAAIYDPRTGLRFMNDLATYEIFWHFLYLTVFHGVELTADGKYVQERRSRHAGALPQAARRAAGHGRSSCSRSWGSTTDKTNAELVLTVLKTPGRRDHAGRAARAAAAMDQVRVARAAGRSSRRRTPIGRRSSTRSSAAAAATFRARRCAPTISCTTSARRPRRLPRETVPGSVF